MRVVFSITSLSYKQVLYTISLSLSFSLLPPLVPAIVTLDPRSQRKSMIGFLCCLDGSSTTEAVLVAPPSAEAAAADDNEQQPRTLASEMAEGRNEGAPGGVADAEDGAFQYHDAEDGATDVFFDARGSSFFQMVNQLPYAPTSTRISGGHRCSLHHPATLLAASTAVLPTRIPEDDVEDDTATATANKLQPRPTTILREQLVAPSSTPASSTSTTPPPLRRSGYPGELSEEELAACLDFRERLRDCNTDPMYRSMVYLNVDIDVVNNNNTTNTNKDVAGQGPEGTYQ